MPPQGSGEEAGAFALERAGLSLHDEQILSRNDARELARRALGDGHEVLITCNHEIDDPRDNIVRM